MLFFSIIEKMSRKKNLPIYEKSQKGKEKIHTLIFNIPYFYFCSFDL